MMSKSELGDLKREMFFRLMDMAGRVFIVIRYSAHATIGKRGFTPEERESGLTLVLNSKMNFIWDDEGIEATLAFQSKPEKCFIPHEDVISIYSPELKVQFFADQIEDDSDEDTKNEIEKAPVKKKIEQQDDNVIRVNFKKDN
jgi:hypothetical protein